MSSSGGHAPWTVAGTGPATGVLMRPEGGAEWSMLDHDQGAELGPDTEGLKGALTGAETGAELSMFYHGQEF